MGRATLILTTAVTLPNVNRFRLVPGTVSINEDESTIRFLVETVGGGKVLSQHEIVIRNGLSIGARQVSGLATVSRFVDVVEAVQLETPTGYDDAITAMDTKSKQADRWVALLAAAAAAGVLPPGNAS